MSRYVLPAAGAVLVAAVSAPAQKPDTPADPENIAAALRLTLAAAAEYEFRVGKDEKPLTLVREPVLKWSNPDRGEVHGNVFLWTRDGRPLVVGSLFKWFRPFTHMSHEFQSFAEAPLTATFHGKPVWTTTEPGVRFEDVPGAPPPAATEAQRLLQMKQLAKDFTGVKTERDDKLVVELRLLPQPIYRYSAGHGANSGGLFTLVHGTDPEIFVLVEAREKDGAARWQYAATRMTSSEVRLRHKGQEVWAADIMTVRELRAHDRAYTSFLFGEVPDFLKPALEKKDAGEKPKP